jgi:hypothetical protein
MNPDSGHLIDLLRKEDKKRLDLPDGYDTIPRRLQAEAMKALAGQQEAHLDLQARTPLAVWAKKKRLAKIAAKSRRRNR